MPSEPCLVLTTFPAEGDVTVVARTLVEERLAACVGLLPPMASIYRWNGAVERAEERQLLIKTTTDAIPQLEARLKVLHPYDVPEYLVLPISGGSADYLSWLTESVLPAKP